jgi:hypothetical protein
MKQSVTFSDFCDAFRAHDRYDSFGYDGLRVIFDFLEDYEDQTGEDIELDVVAIYCDYNLMHWSDIAQEYRIELSHLNDADDDYDEQAEQAVLDYLNNNTMVLGQCVDGIVFQCF